MYIATLAAIKYYYSNAYLLNDVLLFRVNDISLIFTQRYSIKIGVLSWHFEDETVCDDHDK